MASSALTLLCALSSATTALAASLPVAEHVLPLTRTTRRASHKRALGLPITYVSPLAGGGSDEDYVVNITVGGQKFQVAIDTGSSDLWLPASGFACFNLTGAAQPPASCNFGTKGFVASKSKTFVPYPDHNFNISYGSGEYLTGTVGFDNVSIGALTVSQQEFGLVNKAAWSSGDGVTNGILGLGFPVITSVFPGSDPTKDTRALREPYPPFFYSAVAQKKVAQPMFSIALNRGPYATAASGGHDTGLGYLAFGGIAPVPVTNASVTVPTRMYHTPINTTERAYYLVDVAHYRFPGANGTDAGQAILDSGTTLNYLPSAVAAKYNAAFDPPAVYSAEYGVYTVACNATVPSFSVVVGGTTFTIDAQDQILPFVQDAEGNEICASGTQDGGSPGLGAIFILGDTFLHNVVATFNIQDNTTTITQRSKYYQPRTST